MIKLEARFFLAYHSSHSAEILKKLRLKFPGILVPEESGPAPTGVEKCHGPDGLHSLSPAAHRFPSPRPHLKKSGLLPLPASQDARSCPSTPTGLHLAPSCLSLLCFSFLCSCLKGIPSQCKARLES